MSLACAAPDGGRGTVNCDSAPPAVVAPQMRLTSRSDLVLFMSWRRPS